MSHTNESSSAAVDRPPSAPPPRNHSMLLYVAAAVTVLLFLIGLGVAIALWQTVESYTATGPVPLPSAELSIAAQQELQEKLEACAQHLERDEACEIELSAAEINTVVDQQTRLKDRILLTIANGCLQARVSIPFSELGLDGWAGRWLNGEATLSVAKQDGVVHVHLLSVTMNHHPLPSQLQAAIARHNLAEDVASEPEAADYIKRIDRVVVHDGKVRVAFRAPR